MTKVIVAMPAYNEAKYISSVVAGARDHADEVIVVDDGSVDITALLARYAGATVFCHNINRGYGSAIQTIMAIAKVKKPDVLVIIDADCQHTTDDIPRLVSRLMMGDTDIVIGSRSRSDIPFYRYVGGKVLSLFTQLLSGVPISDSQSGFRAYSKKAIDSLDLKENGMTVSSEIIAKAAKCGLCIKEVPISIRYSGDSSTYNPVKQGFSTLWGVIRMFRI